MYNPVCKPTTGISVIAGKPQFATRELVVGDGRLSRRAEGQGKESSHRSGTIHCGKVPRQAQAGGRRGKEAGEELVVRLDQGQVGAGSGEIGLGGGELCFQHAEMVPDFLKRLHALYRWPGRGHEWALGGEVERGEKGL